MLRTGAKEYDEDANMRIVQELHRDALSREESARLHVQKLQRVIEMVEGKTV